MKPPLAPQIADLLPEHVHYVEPFAGSLAVLLAKTPSAAETVNDLDGDLVAFWRVLRDQPCELERVCSLTPHSRAELATSVNLDVTHDVERARRVWVRLTQSRSHSMTGSGWWYRKAPAGRSPAEYLTSYSARLASAAQRLRAVTLESRDALDVIRDYGSEPTCCLYVDPPYLGETRATGYRVEMTSGNDHAALAGALNECRAAVVLSGYGSPLYTALFDGWHRKDLPGPTTLSGDNDRVEVLWSNVPLGEDTLFGGAA